MVDGRSNWLGPNASSEWFRDVSATRQHSHQQEAREEDGGARPSPTPAALPGVTSPFPFSIPSAVTVDYLVGQLPQLDEARAYTEAYFRYFAWQ
jgi:hypothetical protein